MKKTQIFISNETDMLAFGNQLAIHCLPGTIIFLQGSLGAGKTTLVRGILKGLGYQGHVKSPTYTLVERYLINSLTLFHFDLYRLNNPQELFDLGFEDYLNPQSICLIEWPEKALKILPTANIYCRIVIPDNGQGRQIELTQD